MTSEDRLLLREEDGASVGRRGEPGEHEGGTGDGRDAHRARVLFREPHCQPRRGGGPEKGSRLLMAPGLLLQAA